jgi:hypothetical protein
MFEPLLARRDISEMLQDPEFLIVVGILMATLLVGALVLAYVDRWKKRQMADNPTDMDQLGSFRAMFERGELNHEEYEKIRNRVAGRIKESIAPKATPIKPAAPTQDEESLPKEPDSTPPPT